MKNIVRFKFIEAMTLKYGGVNRIHIERCFGIQTAAASRVISKYRSCNPNAIVYVPKARRIKPLGSFEPKFLDIDADTFLAAAQIMAAEEIIQFKRVLC